MERTGFLPWDGESFGMEVLRSDWYRMMFRLQDLFVKGSMDFYREEGLSYVPLPVTTGSISSPMGLGSDSLPVRVELKGQPVYLADSMQFLLEYAARMAERGAFYLMPSFRGEATDRRHLSQFFHSEAEVRGDLEEVMALVERYVSRLSRCILEQMGPQVRRYAGTLSHLERWAALSPVPRVTWSQAVALLEDTPGAVGSLEGGLRFITPAGERQLMDRYGGQVWLTHFDRRTVPFYQASQGRFARNADLLMGIGETVGAGERHPSGREVLEALEEHGVDPAPYDWYVRMKTEFPLQTAGFGMGMERFLLWVLRHDDIRDCQIVSRVDGSAMKP